MACRKQARSTSIQPSRVAGTGCWGGLIVAGLLLVGDGLARALARARVGAGPLAVHRETPAVAQPLVAADLHLAADVGGHLAAQITLDAEVLVDVVAQPQQVLVAEVLDPQVGAHAG